MNESATQIPQNIQERIDRMHRARREEFLTDPRAAMMAAMLGPDLAADLQTFVTNVLKLAVEHPEIRDRLDVAILAVGAALIVDDDSEVREQVADLAHAALCDEVEAAEEMKEALTKTLLDYHSRH